MSLLQRNKTFSYFHHLALSIWKLIKVLAPEDGAYYLAGILLSLNSYALEDPGLENTDELTTESQLCLTAGRQNPATLTPAHRAAAVPAVV